jgi:sortase A
VVVGGHRSLAHADFFRLGELRRGDRLVVRAAWGRFVYRVSALEVVLPSDRTIIVPPAKRRELALVTCHPKFSSARRLIVHARLDESAGGSRPATRLGDRFVPLCRGYGCLRAIS